MAPNSCTCIGYWGGFVCEDLGQRKGLLTVAGQASHSELPRCHSECDQHNFTRAPAFTPGRRGLNVQSFIHALIRL